MASCPVGEDSCEIKVKSCDGDSCSESSSVTVFMDTESASPEDSEAIMEAYEKEQEQLELARALKLEACVAQRELENFPEEEISDEVLALKDGVQAICETSDCDLMLSFEAFQSDFDDLVAEVALLDDLEDDTDDEDTNDDDTNDDDTNDDDVLVIDVDGEGGLSDAEIALTAVSAVLGVALLGAGTYGIIAWRKNVRAKAEANLKNLELSGLNAQLVRLKRDNASLEKKIEAGGNKAELSRMQNLLEDQKAEVLKLKKQRTYLVKEKAGLQAEMDAYKAKDLEGQLKASSEALAQIKGELAKSDGDKALALKQLGVKVTELQDLTSKNLSLEQQAHFAELKKIEADGLAVAAKSEQDRLNILLSEVEADAKVKGVENSNQIAALKNKIKEQSNRIKAMEDVFDERSTELKNLEASKVNLETQLASKGDELNLFPRRFKVEGFGARSACSLSGAVRFGKRELRGRYV